MIIHKRLMTTRLDCCAPTKRSLKDVKAIVIHYTGNKGDTAKGNCNYFKNGDLKRYAGAHYFIDNKQVWQSVPMTRTAYSVGAITPDRSKGGSRWWGVYNNNNTVSIEMCDLIGHGVRERQKRLLKKLVKKIRKKCPNVQRIIRHFDVTGKICPEFYVDNPKKWEHLLEYLY